MQMSCKYFSINKGSENNKYQVDQLFNVTLRSISLDLWRTRGQREV